MAKPNSKDGLKEYALRKLGKPVLEINVDDDQIDDLIDDAIQLYHERHGEGIDRVFLKHKLTVAEKEKMLDVQATTTGTSTAGGLASADYTEGANYLPLPDSIIGVQKDSKLILQPYRLVCSISNIRSSLMIYTTTEQLIYSITP